jgi:hypothetical protein
VDDERIQQITAEVLGQLRSGSSSGEPDLERRVAALEAAVAGLQRSGVTAPAPVAVQAHAHPALRILDVPGGGDRCVLEPDKPCVQSGACRVLGH